MRTRTLRATLCALSCIRLISCPGGRAQVNDSCVLLGKPLVYGAIQTFEGQVSVFNYRGGPNYRDLFPEPPPPGEVPSCAEGGVLGVLPGVIGCMQATEAIKVAIGVEEGTLSGRLLIYDAMRMRFHEVRLKPRANTPPITSLISYEGFCGLPSTDSTIGAEKPSPLPFTCIDAIECNRRIHDDNWHPYVLDVRSRAEAEIVSLPMVDCQQPHRQESILPGPCSLDPCISRETLTDRFLHSSSAVIVLSRRSCTFDQWFATRATICIANTTWLF